MLLLALPSLGLGQGGPGFPGGPGGSGSGGVAAKSPRWLPPSERDAKGHKSLNISVEVVYADEPDERYAYAGYDLMDAMQYGAADRIYMRRKKGGIDPSQPDELVKEEPEEVARQLGKVLHLRVMHGRMVAEDWEWLSFSPGHPAGAPGHEAANVQCEMPLLETFYVEDGVKSVAAPERVFRLFSPVIRRLRIAKLLTLGVGSSFVVGGAEMGDRVVEWVELPDLRECTGRLSIPFAEFNSWLAMPKLERGLPDFGLEAPCMVVLGMRPPKEANLQEGGHYNSYDILLGIRDDEGASVIPGTAKWQEVLAAYDASFKEQRPGDTNRPGYWGQYRLGGFVRVYFEGEESIDCTLNGESVKGHDRPLEVVPSDGWGGGVRALRRPTNYRIALRSDDPARGVPQLEVFASIGVGGDAVPVPVKWTEKGWLIDEMPPASELVLRCTYAPRGNTDAKHAAGTAVWENEGMKIGGEWEYNQFQFSEDARGQSFDMEVQLYSDDLASIRNVKATNASPDAETKKRVIVHEPTVEPDGRVRVELECPMTIDGTWMTSQKDVYVKLDWEDKAGVHTTTFELQHVGTLGERYVPKPSLTLKSKLTSPKPAVDLAPNAVVEAGNEITLTAELGGRVGSATAFLNEKIRWVLRTPETAEEMSVAGNEYTLEVKAQKGPVQVEAFTVDGFARAAVHFYNGVETKPKVKKVERIGLEGAEPGEELKRSLKLDLGDVRYLGKEILKVPVDAEDQVLYYEVVNPGVPPKLSVDRTSGYLQTHGVTLEVDPDTGEEADHPVEVRVTSRGNSGVPPIVFSVSVGWREDTNIQLICPTRRKVVHAGNLHPDPSHSLAEKEREDDHMHITQVITPAGEAEANPAKYRLVKPEDSEYITLGERFMKGIDYLPLPADAYREDLANEPFRHEVPVRIFLGTDDEPRFEQRVTVIVLPRGKYRFIELKDDAPGGTELRTEDDRVAFPDVLRLLFSERQKVEIRVGVEGGIPDLSLSQGLANIQKEKHPRRVGAVEKWIYTAEVVGEVKVVVKRKPQARLILAPRGCDGLKVVRRSDGVELKNGEMVGLGNPLDIAVGGVPSASIKDWEWMERGLTLGDWDSKEDVPLDAEGRAEVTPKAVNLVEDPPYSGKKLLIFTAECRIEYPRIKGKSLLIYDGETVDIPAVEYEPSSFVPKDGVTKSVAGSGLTLEAGGTKIRGANGGSYPRQFSLNIEAKGYDGRVAGRYTVTVLPGPAPALADRKTLEVEAVGCEVEVSDESVGSVLPSGASFRKGDNLRVQASLPRSLGSVQPLYMLKVDVEGFPNGKVPILSQEFNQASAFSTGAMSGATLKVRATAKPGIKGLSIENPGRLKAGKGEVQLTLKPELELGFDLSRLPDWPQAYVQWELVDDGDGVASLEPGGKLKPLRAGKVKVRARCQGLGLTSDELTIDVAKADPVLYVTAVDCQVEVRRGGVPLALEEWDEYTKFVRLLEGDRISFSVRAKTGQEDTHVFERLASYNHADGVAAAYPEAGGELLVGEEDVDLIGVYGKKQLGGLRIPQRKELAPDETQVLPVSLLPQVLDPSTVDLGWEIVEGERAAISLDRGVGRVVAKRIGWVLVRAFATEKGAGPGAERIYSNLCEVVVRKALPSVPPVSTREWGRVVTVLETGVEDERPRLCATPNPTTGRLRLEGLRGMASVSVYNALGVRVLSLETDGELDMFDLPDGLYVLRVGKESFRVVKQHR